MMDKKLAIRPMAETEIPQWGALRLKLWPHCPAAENQVDIDAFISGNSALKIVFLAFDDAEAVGFVEISERSVADGCENDPVAYVEGWYIDTDYRGAGVGRALIDAAKRWALTNDYAYLASDAELHNKASIKAHAALGFEQVSQVVTFSMKLGA